MKRIIIIILALFAAVLLCSCEDRYEASWVEGQDIIVTQSLSGRADASNVVLSTQYPVYGNDCDYIVVIVENNTDEKVMLGLYCMMEKKVGDEWMFVRHASGGTDDIGFYCEPDNSFSTICYLSSLDYDLDDGEYRIVKQVDGFWYAAEFTVGDSEITAETPHGFAPLEKLPADYTLDEAAADGCVCVTVHGDVINGEKLDEFFAYAEQIYWRGQLRIVHTTIEGDLILTDVIRQERDRIDIVRDTTRDAYDIGAISTSYYSFFHNTGENIYVSSYFDLADDPDPFYLISCPDKSAAPGLVGSYYDAFYDGQFSIQSWSPDGRIYAYCRSDNSERPAEFNVTSTGSSRGYLLGDSLPEHTRIIELKWQDANTIMAMAELPDGGYYYEFVHIDTPEELNMERVSYTYSQSKYIIKDGLIVIPE